MLASREVPFQILDGDIMREYLTNDLGFSKEDRDTNVRRIGFVASLLAHQGIIVLCPVISPYRATRAEVRALHDPGRFFEVYIATPVEVCQERDVKGLYARARSGEITGMTGIDDPYEAPLDPELEVAAGTTSVGESVQLIWDALEARLSAC